MPAFLQPRQGVLFVDARLVEQHSAGVGNAHEPHPDVAVFPQVIFLLFELPQQCVTNEPGADQKNVQILNLVSKKNVVNDVEGL